MIKQVLPRLFDIEILHRQAKVVHVAFRFRGQRFGGEQVDERSANPQMHEAYLVAAPVQSAAKDIAVKGD